MDDLRVVDPAQVGGGDPEVGVAKLPLYDYWRHTFSGHLDGVRVAELVRCEPAPHPSRAGGIA